MGEANNSKNQQLRDILFNNSVNTPSLENLLFDQRSIDAKSAVTPEKCPLVEELKLKIRRSPFFSHFDLSETKHCGRLEPLAPWHV